VDHSRHSLKRERLQAAGIVLQSLIYAAIDFAKRWLPDWSTA
jgi:hypothetical protein